MSYKEALQICPNALEAFEAQIRGRLRPRWSSHRSPGPLWYV